MQDTKAGGRTHLFSQVIRAIRLRMRLSQSKFAVRCGVSQPAVAGWESGARPIQESTLEKIADALGIPVEVMLVRGFREMKKTAPKKAPDVAAVETETP